MPHDECVNRAVSVKRFARSDLGQPVTVWTTTASSKSDCAAKTLPNPAHPAFFLRKNVRNMIWMSSHRLQFSR